MKSKIFLFFLIFLTACSGPSAQKGSNDCILAIKNYTCKLQVDFFSNKNISSYSAEQSYKSSGEYKMKFSDNESLTTEYINGKLSLTSDITDKVTELAPYPELNSNPLFLSSFINMYFNTEKSKNIVTSEDSITLTLPYNNPHLSTATLTFQNNIPKNLTYFDENGTPKINIIYNEFISIST